VKGRASHRGFEAADNGINAYRYILVSGHLQCEEAVVDDRAYAAHVHRLRVMAQPSILRHYDHWLKLQRGYDHLGHQIEGYWVNDRGEPLEAGEPTPKEALMGLEGAIMEILHLDGMFWVKERKKSKLRDMYREKGGDEDEDEDEAP
jgi:hypothetical protein